jgi:branched-chain amino acid transport system substrate-binding protein
VRISYWFSFKAIPTLAVGIAFFLAGCQPKPAVETVPKLVQEEPTVQDLIDRAERSLQVGDYNQAITTFRQVISQTPDHPQAALIRYQIAYCFFQIGNYQKALDESLEWLNLFPDHNLLGETLFLIGRSYQALKDPHQAFEWFVKASAHFDPSSIKRHEIDTAIMSLIDEADTLQLEQMAWQAEGTELAPQIYYQITIRLLDENRLDEAKVAAMHLVRSSSKQYWVSLGRQLLDRIERDLTPKEGVIGCLLPLSGPYSIYGQEALNGIQLGMDILNSTGTGATMELIIRDTAGDVNQTIAAIEELAAIDNLMAIIGPLASQTATVAAQKAQELEIPIIILTQKDGLAAEGSMVFRNFLTPVKEISRLVNLALGEMGIKRFGILYPDNSYGRYFMNLFWDQLDEKGGVVKAVESYPPEATDFGDQIKKMVGLYYPRPESIARLLVEMKKAKESLEASTSKETTDKETATEAKEKDEGKKEEPEPFIDFDAVFIPDNYNEVALIAPQFPFYRVFNIQLLGTSLWHSQELIDQARDYVQGAVFPVGFFKEQNSEAVQQFIEAYRAGFDADPGLLAATGFDTIRLLKQVFENYKILNRKDIQTSLGLIRDFQGVTGKISFDEQGEVEKTPFLLTISGNRFVALKNDE